MPKLPVISGAECIKALSKAGFYEDRQKGSHIRLKRDDPQTALTVPLHKTLKPGTLRGIIRQAGLTVDEFIALLNWVLERLLTSLHMAHGAAMWQV